MRRRNTLAGLLVAASVLAACGPGDTDDAANDTLPAPAAEAPSTEPALTPTDSADDADAAPPAETPAATDAAPAADEPAATEPADEPATTDAAPVDEPAAEPEPPATEAPAPEPAAAPDAVIGGRAFASEITTDSTVLPDLLVDDINRGQKINLQNVFPAERPVLFWAFAPH